MNVNNASTTVETVKLNSEFQRLRDILVQDEFADRLNRPLAYWALPVDRRLPMAFLGRTLRELFETPFEELTATPGIGQKKIGTLIELLAAVKKNPPGVRLSEPAEEKPPKARPSRSGGEFDPSMVSEGFGSGGARPSHGTMLGRKARPARPVAAIAAHRDMGQAAIGICQPFRGPNATDENPRRKANPHDSWKCFTPSIKRCRMRRHVVILSFGLSRDSPWKSIAISRG